MTGRYYKLDYHRNVVPCGQDDQGREAWIVARDDVGPYFISTVFAAMDLSTGTAGPLSFETKIFFDFEHNDAPLWDEPKYAGVAGRAHSWDEAIERHRAIYQTVLRHLETRLGVPYTPYQHDDIEPGPIPDRVALYALEIVHGIAPTPRPDDQPDRRAHPQVSDPAQHRARAAD